MPSPLIEKGERNASAMRAYHVVSASRRPIGRIMPLRKPIQQTAQEGARSH